MTLPVFLLSLLIGGCAWLGGGARVPPPPAMPPNLLVFVADDLGVDKVGAYGAPGRQPPMPHVDALAAQGVLFRRAYSNPTCGPARASMWTGMWASRVGVGQGVRPNRRRGALALDVRTLPERLSDGTAGAYTTSLVGKWHLSDRGTGGAEGPLLQGFDHHRGPLGNLHGYESFDGEPQDYDSWEKATDGAVARSKVYVTRDNVREARAAVETLAEPWLVVVSFTAPHEPFHVPPASLRTGDVDDDAMVPDRYDAMVSSVDRAVGLVLDGLTPGMRARTNVVFTADNGTPGFATRAPFPANRAKGTVYEGGIRVPLVVSGPAVAEPGRRTDALVHLVDLTPTLLDLAGATEAALTAPTMDGVSFAPLLRDPTAAPTRTLALSEWYEPNGAKVGARPERYEVSVYDGTWKWVRDGVGVSGLYRLDGDAWFEGDNLLRSDDVEADAQLARLKGALLELTGRDGPSDE